MSGHRVQFADLPPHRASPRVPKQNKSNLKVTSPEDAERIGRRQASPNGTPPTRGDAKGSRTVPRRHTLGGARGSREILAMQPPDMDKKREAFLEHLKQKYPHHASAIMGHQERLREQSLQVMLSSLHAELDIQKYLMKIQSSHTSRSPKHGPPSQPCGGDQVDHLSLASLESLDAMSEVEAPTAFTRGSRVRASLPVVRSTNQTKDRSLGVLYLQYGDETKQIRMPNEITSVDTVRALFVSAFPQQLTMKMLESPSMAVYVKDDMRNVYYELSDVRSITDHSCLKVYHKDPAQAFSHGPRPPPNTDARIHHDRQPPLGPPPHHPVQGGGIPPSPHSMPPSPSRIPFGPRPGSIPGSSTLPRERLAAANPSVRSVSPCPSAILERRDVKPDEDLGGKSHTLTRGGEALYADPYLLQEGRMSITSAHGPHSGLDGPDHPLGGFHRASIRSTSSYGGPSPTDTVDHPSLYRQKSRNSQLPTLGSKTPPPSPHRMTEVRMIDIHGVPPHGVPPHGVPPHGVPMERGSPVRQSLRKEEAAGTKPRNSMGSPVVAEPPVLPQGPVPPAGDPQTRQRMKAMEQQIASLTGLVQHALLKGPKTSGSAEPQSERPLKTSSPSHSSGGSPVMAPKTNAVQSETGSLPVKVNLLHFRKNVSDLRLQLHQMRQLQLQNQEALRAQLKRAEQEISVKLSEAMRRQDDPVQRQRTLVEEDRHKYLGLEERVLEQLSDLEQYVSSLQRDTASTQRTVTLKDVEDGALTLRKVGESLAGLKGEFPALQTRMRAVLRVEVEAVKFLKEEPHKLDSMLKRVRTLTETLGSLRRLSTQGSQRGSDPPVDNSPPLVGSEPSPPAPLDHQNSTVRSEVMPSSPVVIHQVRSSPVNLQQSQQSAALTSQPSPPLTPSPTQGSGPNPVKGQDRESAKGVSLDPPSPVHQKKTHGILKNNGTQVLVMEELQSHPDKSKSRALSIEAAEKEWEEKRQNLGFYNGKEFEKILQEAQVNMMKGIPNLEIVENTAAPPAVSGDGTNNHSPVESPSDPPSEDPDSKPVKKLPEKPPKPAVEKPLKPASKPPSPDVFTKHFSEKSSRSPPPPPPRKTYPSSNSGMTTTRSGAVVYTSRKESSSAQEVEVEEEEEEEEVAPPTPQPRPGKVPPETRPKPTTPPPVAPATREEEDEGDKMMAELQVFQKCTVKDGGVETTTPVEPQIRELRPGPLLPPKQKKSSETREEKDPDTDENGNTTLRQSQAVIYYVTGQISKDQPAPAGSEETPALPPTQVSNVNVNDNSPDQEQELQEPQSPPPKSPPALTPPPISPKPVGLNGFKLVKKQVKRSDSFKTRVEMEKKKMMNKVNTEKKSWTIKEPGSSNKNIIPEAPEKTTAVAVKQTTLASVSDPLTPRADNNNPEPSHFEDDEGAGLSPDLPGEEAPPPPDNIAFMITNTKVQALSCGEYQELVNAKKGSVQTVTVGSAANRAETAEGSPAPQDNRFSKKPVIIIFDEPMDIHSAYKRLSTIFECEEELDRMLSEERIEEESEESDTDPGHVSQVKRGGAATAEDKKAGSSQGNSDHVSLSSSSSSSMSELTDSGINLEPSEDSRLESKKKFKFKFPKKQLAALTQAIRTGTKSGKKTLQVVVYEDEEESDGTVRQHKEAKRFEISRSKSFGDSTKVSGPVPLKKQEFQYRTDEIRKNTYKTLDSLEQTIKQLETTINEMGPRSPEEPLPVKEAKTESVKTLDGGGLKRSSSLPTTRASGPKVSTQQKTKPQLLPRPVLVPSVTTTTPSSATNPPSAPRTVRQNTSVASPTSRMPVPLSAKTRQSPGSSDKAGKQQKLQEAQRQYRQANGSAKRVGGDHKTTPPTGPISKIPAFYPSANKGSCSQTIDATNPTNPPCSSSSVTKSSILSSNAPRSSTLPPSSHIPSLSNGSLKPPPPSQHTGKALSFSSQTQNGRVHSSSSSSSSFSSSSSSSSPSPLSPTPLGQGGRSIRTIHTPSFTSYRSHNGSSGKSCIPTVTSAKDTA